jgi:hypothetical protein
MHLHTFSYTSAVSLALSRPQSDDPLKSKTVTPSVDILTKCRAEKSEA